MNEGTVVGWDGSLEAEQALEWAVRRAEQNDDAILLVGCRGRREADPRPRGHTGDGGTTARGRGRACRG
ncbi:MAG: universal stress protein [Leifsonia sp.]